ncbi:MAG: Tim44/TimA family putative adaptor protein [Hyphomicrobiaceae bacterium]|nr:Tim44/TimA family putative adaptor protein [Hyphomicrobiaceae bacterium]
MDGQIDIITLISLIVAVVAILKLRSVLGRRTGDEESRIERYRAEARAQEAKSGADKVVTLPRRGAEVPGSEREMETSGAEAQARIKVAAGSDASIEQGLLAILARDPNFDPEHFLRGARQAYEMVVTAFAEGNRRVLKDLLSPDVYEGFVGAIADREARGEQVDQSFVGIQKADILEADVKGGSAAVSVRFVSQLISATRDRSGEVVDGDPQRVKEVTDIWTFARDVSNPRALANPNWKLVATQAPN